MRGATSGLPGKWLGGITPYGYRVNDEGFLELNDDPLPGFDLSEAGVVRLIYQLVADQGYSTIKVADYLNALGVPPSYTKDGRQMKTKDGKRREATTGIWRPSRIRNMIVNSTCKGLHHYGKRTKKSREVIPRLVPAIVSTETWERAQQVLRDNQLEAMRNSKRRYLLRGLLKCGVCGLNYSGTAYTGPGGKLKAYYVCNGKTTYRGPLNRKCTSKNVPQQWIEDLVWNDCVRFIDKPGEALAELEATMEEKKVSRSALDSERDLALQAAREKDIEKQKILDLYRKGIIGHLDVEQQLQKIAGEKAALEARARDIEQQAAAAEDLAQQFETAEELLNDLRKKLVGDPTFETRREIVKTLVREVTVKTEPGENRRPRASVTARYSFSRMLFTRESVQRIT